MSSSNLHLQCFEGGLALSAFRAQALLSRLQAAVPRVRALQARYVHWVSSGAPLDATQTARLAELLRYGDAAAPAADGAPGRRHAAPGHPQPLGQQGQRHRTQLRFCHRACRALHRVHAAAGQAPAGLGPAAR
jgi:hypothetical protein